MVLTDEQKTDIYLVAHLEGDQTCAQNVYDINTNKIFDKPSDSQLGYANNNGFNGDPCGDNAGTNAKMCKLFATSSGADVGLGMSLKVMAGDKINIFGKSYYTAANSTQTNYANTVTQLIAGLLGTGGGGSAAIAKGATTTNLGTNAGTLAANSFLTDPNRGSGTIPKAYINWVLFDEQFNYVTGGFSRVDGNANTLKDHHSDLTNISMAKSGYLYIYASNESPVAVFFDNLQVTHSRSAILEESHYYPFGLVMSGISSKAANVLENKRKWNKGSELESKEFSDGSGLELYSTQYRSLDPQLGRFWQIDPKPDYAQSLYSLMSNNPIRFNDPLGDSILSSRDNAVADRIVNTANRNIASNNTTIANNNKTIQEARDKIASGKLNEKETKAANKTINKLTEKNTELASRNDQLNTGIAAIAAMRADVNHNYSFSSPSSSEGDHYVTQGRGKNVTVEGSTDGLFLHESVHVLQSINAGGLRFSPGGKLFNASGTRVGQLNNEVQSYRVQFSFDGSFIPDERANNLSDIKAEVVGRHY